MARSKSKYVCQQCGYSQTGWAGKCPECEAWGSLVETTEEDKKGSRGSSTKPANLKKISDIAANETSRTKTRISELDRVLGGGIVPGQVILIAGEPGIGKSTILLQVADALGKVIYVTGEESPGQVKIRAERLKVAAQEVSLLDETNIEKIISTYNAESTGKDKVNVLIIDSIQTMVTNDLSGMPGSVGQVREVANRLVRVAKKNQVPIFIVGHVTKQGSVAGPAALAHVVDTVLWFEGDKNSSLRLLRAVKNRFGPTDEVGIFSMEDSGLISIENISKLFLSEQAKAMPGSAIGTVLEGTRPLLIEVQSLVVPSKLAIPRRVAHGIDAKRLELILAVLTRRAGLSLSDFDVYANVVGGISVKEPGLDLALALSIASAYFDKALPKDLVAVGEVGLLGEVRPVSQQEKRIKNASRQGYKNVVTNKDYQYLRNAVKDLLK